MFISINKSLILFVSTFYLASWPLYAIRGGSYFVLFFNILCTILAFFALPAQKSKFCIDFHASILFSLLITSSSFYFAVSTGNNEGVLHLLKLIYYISPAIVIVFISSFVKKTDCLIISKYLFYIGIMFQFMLIVIIARLETYGGKFNYESSILNFSSNELSYFYTLSTFPFAYILYKKNEISKALFLVSICLLFIHISKAHLLSLILSIVFIFIYHKPFKATITFFLLALLITLSLPQIKPVGNKQIDKLIKATNLLVISIKYEEISIDLFKNVLEEGYDRNRSAIASNLKSFFLVPETILGVGNKAESKINDGWDFHNTYYAVYYELGLVGLIIFISMFLFLFWIRKDSEYKGLILFILSYFLIRSYFITFDYSKIVVLVYLIYKISGIKITSSIQQSTVCVSKPRFRLFPLSLTFRKFRSNRKHYFL